MKLSVVVPSVNEESQISGAVRSALAARAYEVVVVDGGSEDNTCRVASEAGARVLSSGPGRAVQQNAGVRATTGDVLLFLHADCRLPAGAVAQIEQVLSDRLVVGGSFVQQIEADGWLYRWLERGNA